MGTERMVDHSMDLVVLVDATDLVLEERLEGNLEENGTPLAASTSACSPHESSRHSTPTCLLQNGRAQWVLKSFK